MQNVRFHSLHRNQIIKDGIIGKPLVKLIEKLHEYLAENEE